MKLHGLATLIVVLPSGVFAQTPAVDFYRDVQPILADKCYHCHGPDGAERQADLRLDRSDSALADRGGYAVVVPGDADASELIRRIFDPDPDVRMPPADSGRTLDDRQKRILKHWIAQGAGWQRHWAFEPPRRPALPAVKHPAWVRNPIDLYVLARFEAEGLSPAPPATKETLIRRVTLDLTGLPPTAAEVDAFLNDPSPDAYERVVERLLNSPRYGERMALAWLDAARYADTDGYQNDGPRDMWRWRDWVIEAYNQGMPFDQFTIEQLAGDLLPKASLDQRIATGFNRNHRYNSEAGLVLEEFLLENAVDRVDTTSTVWTGLTAGCARCHDHKYDPLSQREYYQLIALFDNVSESGRAVKFGNSEPWVVAPTRLQQGQLEAHQERERRTRQALSSARDAIDAALEQWLASAEEKDFSAPVVASGLAHRFALDGDQTSESSDSASDEPVEEPTAPGVFGNAALLDGTNARQLGKVGDVVCQQRSSVCFWMYSDDLADGVVLSRQANNTRRPGIAVELRDQRLQFYIITRWLAGVGAVETIDSLPPRQWTHIVLTNDGSQSAGGMHIYVNGQRAKTRVLYNTNSNTGGTDQQAPLRIGGGVHGPPLRGRMDELRFYDRTLWQDEIALLAVGESVQQIAERPPSQRSESQQVVLRGWFLEHAAPNRLGRLQQQFHSARMQHQKFQDALPTTMVMDELNPPRPTHVRIRGQYNQLGEPVEADVPAVFGPPAAGPVRNRLDYARWLVDGRHPLTARVAVNRYWQQHFGRGLVATPEDFGVQGEPPSHPELLDWLAMTFVDSGWDVKAMQRLMVTSATYRQSSRGTPELAQRDPENRLLARMPRHRLTAHALRDQALFVGGLLDQRLGGPSVSPYQPADLWEEMSNMTYRQSKGADLYRRSMYTIWKRTVAPPSMLILDAADRESCAIRPKRTNTPLQALTLLNETTFVESARHLAERMLREGGSDPVRYGFVRVVSRQPTAQELVLLKQAAHDYQASFADDPAAARQLVSVGESSRHETLDVVRLAAYTALANVLLNLDEAVTKP